MWTLTHVCFNLGEMRFADQHSLPFPNFYFKITCKAKWWFSMACNRWFPLVYWRFSGAWSLSPGQMRDHSSVAFQGLKAWSRAIKWWKLKPFNGHCPASLWHWKGKESNLGPDLFTQHTASGLGSVYPAENACHSWWAPSHNSDNTKYCGCVYV